MLSIRRRTSPLLSLLAVSALSAGLVVAAPAAGSPAVADAAAHNSEPGSPSAATAPPTTPPEASAPDGPAAGPVQLEIIAGDLEIVATLRRRATCSTNCH